jgi:hypothetical protein
MLRQQKNQTAHLRNTLRALVFFASVTSPLLNGLHFLTFPTIR